MEVAQEVYAQGSNPLSEKRWLDYGFDLESLPRYKLRDITLEEASTKGFSQASDGIYIEYPRDEDSRVRWHRSGFNAQLVAGKYGQRANSLPALYIPHTLKEQHLTDADIPIILTEGEFKAIACDCIANVPGAKPLVIPVAIGGVYMWQSAKRGIDCLPEIKRLCTGGRKVYLAFDMDQSTNPQVSLALQRLADKLSEFGCHVMIMQWPDDQGKGLDDYLTGQSFLRRQRLADLIENAAPSGFALLVMQMNDQFIYDRTQVQVWNRSTGKYIPTNSFKADFFTQKLSVQAGVKNGKTVSKTMTFGQYWLESPIRATCDGKRFVPGAQSLVRADGPFGAAYLNTWQAWGKGSPIKYLKPVKGDIPPFLKYLNATFGGEKTVPSYNGPLSPVDYLIKRLAWMFQQPTAKHPTWIYLIGKPMQGKSKLINILSVLIGGDYVSHINEDNLKSAFTEWMAEKLLVAFDDAQVIERGRIKQTLKRLTTEVRSTVNRKYEQSYSTENYTNFFFATNSLDPLLDHDDRRALVLEAKCEWDKSKGEWDEFDAWCALPSSYCALLHYFMYDVQIDASFLTERPPLTHTRELVTESAESGWDEFLHALTSPIPMQWRAPASGELRKMTPSIMTPEIIVALFTILHGPSDNVLSLKTGTLSAKLQRFGATRVHPIDSGDSRGRLGYRGKITTVWAWESKWIDNTCLDITKHLQTLHHAYPELFSAFDSKDAGKF